MHTPKYDPETYTAQQSYSARQLSRYDMEVAGVVVYIVAMTVFFVVALVMMLFGNESVTQARAQAAKARRLHGDTNTVVSAPLTPGLGHAAAKQVGTPASR